MNEGKGLMLKVAMDYKKGIITEKVLQDICKDNRWDYKKDNCYGVLIFPKIHKSAIKRKEE